MSDSIWHTMIAQKAENVRLKRELASANARIAFLESVEGGQVEAENVRLKRELASANALLKSKEEPQIEHLGVDVTLESFLGSNVSRGVIDFSLRANIEKDGRVTFYIHPNCSGDTADYEVSSNTLKAIKKVGAKGPQKCESCDAYTKSTPHSFVCITAGLYPKCWQPKPTSKALTAKDLLPMLRAVALDLKFAMRCESCNSTRELEKLEKVND